MLNAGVGWANGSNTSSTFVSTRLHESPAIHSQAAAAVVTMGTGLLSWIPINAHARLQLHSTLAITKERSSGAKILAVMNAIFAIA